MKAIRDIEVTVKLRNNQLMTRRREAGLTAIEVATAAGVNQNTYGGLETMRVSPLRTLRDHHCQAVGCPKNYSPNVSYKFCAKHAREPLATRDAWEAAYVPATLVAWSKAADALAAFYCCSPEELFPESLRAIKKTTIVSEMDVPQLMALAGVASGDPTFAEMVDGVEQEDVRKALVAAAAALLPKEQLAVDALVCNRTIDESAEELGVCRERAYQILNKALGKMRKNRQLRAANGTL